MDVPCERCLELKSEIVPAMATVYENDDDTTGSNWCVGCTIAFIAPIVLMGLQMMHDELHRCAGDRIRGDECQWIMAGIAAAVADGHGDVLFIDVSKLVESDQFDGLLLKKRLRTGDIGPADFGA